MPPEVVNHALHSTSEPVVRAAPLSTSDAAGWLVSLWLLAFLISATTSVGEGVRASEILWPGVVAWPMAVPLSFFHNLQLLNPSDPSPAGGAYWSVAAALLGLQVLFMTRRRWIYFCSLAAVLAISMVGCHRVALGLLAG